MEPLLVNRVSQFLSSEVTEIVFFGISLRINVRQKRGQNYPNYMKTNVIWCFSWGYVRYGIGIASYKTKPNTRFEFGESPKRLLVLLVNIIDVFKRSKQHE